MSGLTDAAEPVEQAQDRRRSFDILFFVLLVVAGLVLAGVWRLIVPGTADLGDEQETQAAVVLVRPGPRPARRSLVAIVGSAVAGAVTWQLGDQLGTPELTATSAAFVWPVATAVATFAGAMFPGTSRRLNDSLPAYYEVTPDERSGPSGPS